jgi:phage-related protein
LSVERRLAFHGKIFRIAFARDHDGAYPAEEFFDQLAIADKAKMDQLFRILGDHGKHSNPEKFGDLGDGLYEFKSFQIRMPFVYAKNESSLVLITHGFKKKRDKAPPAEIARAKRILEEDAKSSKVFVITDQKTKRKRP